MNPFTWAWDMVKYPWEALDKALDRNPPGRKMRAHLGRIKAMDADDGKVELTVGHDIEGCNTNRKIGVSFEGSGAALVNKTLDYSRKLTRSHIKRVAREHQSLAEKTAEADRIEEEEVKEKKSKNKKKDTPAEAPAAAAA